MRRFHGCSLGKACDHHIMTALDRRASSCAPAFPGVIGHGELRPDPRLPNGEVRVRIVPAVRRVRADPCQASVCPGQQSLRQLLLGNRAVDNGSCSSLLHLALNILNGRLDGVRIDGRSLAERNLFCRNGLNQDFVDVVLNGQTGFIEFRFQLLGCQLVLGIRQIGKRLDDIQVIRHFRNCHGVPPMQRPWYSGLFAAVRIRRRPPRGSVDSGRSWGRMFRFPWRPFRSCH